MVRIIRRSRIAPEAFIEIETRLRDLDARGRIGALPRPRSPESSRNEAERAASGLRQPLSKRDVLVITVAMVKGITLATPHDTTMWRYLSQY
jgi:hypothetical protein